MAYINFFLIIFLNFCEGNQNNYPSVFSILEEDWQSMGKPGTFESWTRALEMRWEVESYRTVNGKKNIL